jgi:hypothetical protein
MRNSINKKGICKSKIEDKGIKKKGKKIPKNQFEGMDKWLEHYNEHNKLPYNEIFCCECKSYTAKLKGVGFKHAFENAGKDIKKMLSGTMCKECKAIKAPKEKKVPVKRIKTPEEIEEEIEQIRRDMPKIDLNAPRQIINLKENKEFCKEITRSMCLRPDIYLNNDRTCDNCSIHKYCSCAIKKLSSDSRRKN